MNKHMLIGNAGNNPELRYTQSGTSVTNLRLATHETFTKDGRRVEETDWHRLVFFGKLAEIVNKWVTQGDKLYVCGRSQTRKWEDSNGATRYTTEVIVREVEFLTPKSKNAPTHATGDDAPTGWQPPKMEDDVPF